jgi:hypothetical protein
MAKKRIWLVIPAIALVFGIAVLGACSSGPKAFMDVDPIMPDAQSAVVYFQGSSDAGSVWDGDKPIGNYDEKKMPFMPIIAYKTTPGEHYFIAHASNWVVIRARLDANKRYFVNISPVPSPPYTRLIIMNPISGEDGEGLLSSRWTTIIAFSDEWRAEFAQGNLLKEVQGKLQEAKSSSMDVGLSGKDGI